jgi:hypothetical protein
MARSPAAVTMSASSDFASASSPAIRTVVGWSLTFPEASVAAKVDDLARDRGGVAVADQVCGVSALGDEAGDGLAHVGGSCAGWTGQEPIGATTSRRHRRR